MKDLFRRLTQRQPTPSPTKSKEPKQENDQHQYEVTATFSFLFNPNPLSESQDFLFFSPNSTVSPHIGTNTKAFHGEKTSSVWFCVRPLHNHLPWPCLIHLMSYCWGQESKGEWILFLFLFIVALSVLLCSVTNLFFPLWLCFCAEERSKAWWEAVLFTRKPCTWTWNCSFDMSRCCSGYWKLVNLQNFLYKGQKKQLQNSKTQNCNSSPSSLLVSKMFIFLTLKLHLATTFRWTHKTKMSCSIYFMLCDWFWKLLHATKCDFFFKI